MVRISVDAKSLTTYGTAAEHAFKAVRTELTGLVHSCATVPYEGPNSAAFKNGCGKLASDFSTSLLADIGKFTEAVREVTTGIARSLGGHPVSIQFNGSPVTAPTVPSSDGNFTMVDTAPLHQLKATVHGHFGKINTHLDEHLRAFQQAKWEGHAREAAHGALKTFTTNTKADVSEAQNKISKFIDEQIQSATSADQA
jgi:hypothetical protein